MRRVSLAMLFLGGLMAVGSSPAQAQERSFGVGSTYLGPVIGFGGIGSAGVSFGGRIEHGFWKVPSLGDGVIGIEGSFDYYHYSAGFAGTDYKFSYIPFGVTANYHFKIKNPKFDAFLGAGLGYEVISTPYNGAGYGSSLYFVGRAGGRYLFTKSLALYADIGAGAAVVDVGIMFAIGSKK